MRRWLLLISTVLVSYPVAAAPEETPAVVVLAPVTPEAARIKLLNVGAAVPISGLEIRSRCSESKRRSAEVELRWRAEVPATGEQRVDVSKFRDGWVKGRYETSGVPGPATRAVVLEGPEPGINYYWRVLVRGPNGWIASATARFEVPVCPYDEPLQTRP